MVIGYLLLIECGKKIFYRAATVSPKTRRPYSKRRHLQRRAAQFSSADR
jgi:Mg2+-importing ATPase